MVFRWDESIASALYELFIKRARSFIVKMCATLGTLLAARDYGNVTGS